VFYQSSFDFGSGQTVATNVDDIVNPAADPVEALVIPASAVARELEPQLVQE
jgi:hypothetical protein